MNTIYPNLCRKLAECQVSYATLADSLHISITSLILKMEGAIPWELAEAVMVCSILHTSDIEDLFVQLDNKL